MIIIQAAVLTLLAFIVLFQLISNRHIVIVNEPAFWIAGGLLCYFGMVVFIEAIAGNQSDLPQQIQQEKDLMITVADILRMILFSVAAGIAGKQPGNNRQ
jgi:putative Mn2+ efflux pump MntP